MKNNAKRVLVALSGGVDSSVTATILKHKGYSVSGAFIKTWSVPWLPCTWREERRDAMRVAAKLRIPFYTVDLSKEYERDVVAYMIGEYRKGRTPNPDVMCNTHIKFGGFYQWAKKKGFDSIATGHYARVESRDGVMHLLAGADKNKDQSYFLWTLTQEHLRNTLFPLGNFKKSDVRKLAREEALFTAEKKDSQGICFLGKVDMKSFLQKYIPSSEGIVLNTKKEKIGTHDGALFFTMGQRHGFTVEKKTPTTPPLYVIAKDVEQNTITVAAEQEAHELAPKMFPIHTIHFINNATVPETFQCQARIRYRQPLFPVTVQKRSTERFEVVPEIPQPYVSYGQSIVFYEGEECLGGAIIG